VSYLRHILCVNLRYMNHILPEDRLTDTVYTSPRVESTGRRVAKTLAACFDPVLESAIHRTTDRREELCPEVRAWRRGNPDRADAPSYPHLWITLCVSEGDSRVG